MQNIPSIPRLDLMVAYSCNIKCLGCISISDIPRNGVAPFEDVVQWTKYWSAFLSPEVIVIFGGEPLMHPKFKEICGVVRSAWPNSTIRVITNGYLLHKIDPVFWHTLGKLEMQLSIHRLDHEKQITQEITKIVKQYKNWKVIKHPEVSNGHRQISITNGTVTIWKSYFKDFVTPYKQVQGAFAPHSSDPASAHAICGSPNTPILYKGKLYKCPPVANLIDLTGENWNNYQACCGADDLAQFIDNIGKPEKVCSQCPSQDTATIYDHMNKDTVHVKLKNFN